MPLPNWVEWKPSLSPLRRAPPEPKRQLRGDPEREAITFARHDRAGTRSMRYSSAVFAGRGSRPCS